MASVLCGYILVSEGALYLNKELISPGSVVRA